MVVVIVLPVLSGLETVAATLSAIHELALPMFQMIAIGIFFGCF